MVVVIRYSTNWMGPVSIKWYRDRGMTKMVDRVLSENNLLGKPAGTVVQYEEQTQHWSAGRIDIRGTGDPFGDEISLPTMLSEDWGRFSQWLRTVETDNIWTLKQLIELYEKTNPKITWWNYDQDNF